MTEPVSYDPAEPVLTVNDLMARWRCTRKIILDAIKAKRLSAFKIGKRVYRVRLDEVERYELAQAGAA
jgi:hypothetical protein